MAWRSVSKNASYLCLTMRYSRSPSCGWSICGYISKLESPCHRQRCSPITGNLRNIRPPYGGRWSDCVQMMGIRCSRAKRIRRSRLGIIARAPGVSSRAPSATKAFCMSMTISAARRGSTVKKSFPQALIFAAIRDLLSSAFWLFPDAALVHQRDLPVDHLLLILGVLHGHAIEVEILGIDRLLVDDLIELGAQVFHPVVPLGARAMVAQRLDIDHPAHVTRAAAVFQLAHFLPLVIEDVGAPAKGIDGRGVFGKKEIRSQVRGDDVHVVVERAGRTLNLEEIIAAAGMRVGRPVHDFRAVHGQSAGIFGVRAFVRHHDAHASDGGDTDRPEGVEAAPVFLDPPVVDVVRANRM